MRIAIDVKGTLEGPKEQIIRLAAELLWRKGHEVVVWSNMTSFAHDFVKKYDFPYGYTGKKMASDCYSEDELYDVAIEDDRSQTWLAAKKIIFVDECSDVNTLLFKILGE